jgi:hypothetical protein
METNSKKRIFIGTITPYRSIIACFLASLAEQLLNMIHDIKIIAFRKKYPKSLYPDKTEKGNSQPRSSANKNSVNPLTPSVTDKEYCLPICAGSQTSTSIVIPAYSINIKLIWNTQLQLVSSIEQVT